MRGEDERAREEVDDLRRRNAELAAENARLRAERPARRPAGEPEPAGQGRRLALMRALAEATRTIMRAPDLQATLQAITDAARAIVGARRSVCSLAREPDWSGPVEAVSLSGDDAPPPEHAGLPEGDGAARTTPAEPEALRPRRGGGPRAGARPPPRGRLAASLVGSDGRNLGLIQLSDKADGEFDELDESKRALAAAVDRLPAEQREVLVMKIWNDLTFADIASVLNISQNTAASRYRYALAALKKNLIAHE